MANLVDFPVPLCSIAEQLYITGLNKDFGAQDDAGLVRLWTSEPVTSLPPLSDEDKKAKLELVSNLLNGIHLCAAAEGISFAKHLGVPLPQYYELCVEAAGGSTQYKEQGIKMIDILEGKQEQDGASLSSYRDGLKAAISEARDKKIPLHLGNGALSLVEQAGKEQSLASLLKLYAV
jgi:3-hydroxyisobutyrate dehydrogenase